MKRAEREVLAKLLYDEYHDNADGQISYESLADKYNCSTSTAFRLIRGHKEKLLNESVD